ncbi:VOC family protein [Streptomyces sp. EMB24]|uniref:VOC family protein n=1 Tax=Streptomyces sp. EMB24 TaxID=2835531 RepID=UPI00227C2ECA|nr:VOC family protein [Streptomyces sp. EMB24]
MQFASVRVITADVARLVAFYERVLGVSATWATEHFAEVRTDGATLAIAGTATVRMFAPGSARPADNHSAIVEFLVDDVDRVHKELADVLADVVNGPATMPWGNRSLLFRDPDGNLLNFFSR